MIGEPKPSQRKRKLFYRQCADGTIIGPAHTQAYLHLMVASYRLSQMCLRRIRGDAGLD